MGDVTKIVIEHYPVDKLPEELRRGIETGRPVRVTIEVETEGRTLASFIGSAPGRYAEPASIVHEIRELRDEWGGSGA